MAEITSAKGIKNTDAEIRDAVLNDATKFPGGNIDAAISSRSSHSAADVRQSVCSGDDPAGSIGKLLNDYLDAAVSGRSSHSAADVWAVATRALTDKAGFELASTEYDNIRKSVCLGTDPADSIGRLLKDHLDAAISSRASESGGNLADVKTQTDKLAGGTAQGTASAGTSTPTDIFEMTITSRRKIHAVWLDLSNLTAGATIKLYYKIDGTNYRVFETYEWTTSDEDGVYFNKGLVMEHDFKVEITGGEGAAVDIPYECHYEEM